MPRKKKTESNLENSINRGDAELQEIETIEIAEKSKDQKDEKNSETSSNILIVIMMLMFVGLVMSNANGTLKISHLNDLTVIQLAIISIYLLIFSYLISLCVTTLTFIPVALSNFILAIPIFLQTLTSQGYYILIATIGLIVIYSVYNTFFSGTSLLTTNFFIIINLIFYFSIGNNEILGFSKEFMTLNQLGFQKLSNEYIWLNNIINSDIRLFLSAVFLIHLLALAIIKSCFSDLGLSKRGFTIPRINKFMTEIKLFDAFILPMVSILNFFIHIYNVLIKIIWHITDFVLKFVKKVLFFCLELLKIMFTDVDKLRKSISTFIRVLNFYIVGVIIKFYTDDLMDYLYNETPITDLFSGEYDKILLLAKLIFTMLSLCVIILLSVISLKKVANKNEINDSLLNISARIIVALFFAGLIVYLINKTILNNSIMGFNTFGIFPTTILLMIPIIFIPYIILSKLKKNK